jgi:hypothetical protein
MKRLIVLSALFSIVSFPAFAGQQAPQPAPAEMVMVKKSDLTADQLAKVQANEVREQLGAYSEYAQMGRGIGMAFGEALRSVKDVTLELAGTDVGKYAMILIAWKVMARDVISMGDMVFGYAMGPFFFVIGTSILLWSYRRQCVPRRIVKKSTREGWKVTREYEMFEPNRDGKVSEWALWHLAAEVCLVLLVCMVMFAG